MANTAILQKKKKTGWMILLLLIAFTSCLEDTGNYDYLEINEVSISGINDEDTPYYTTLGDSLKIAPTLAFSLGEESEVFKYEWHLMKITTTPPRQSIGVLSDQRNLAITVGGLINAEGTYQLMYCITNLNTSVRYDHLFTLVVQDRMQVGYIMLCEKESDSFDIDLISLFRDTLTHYHNALDIYDSELPRTGRKPIDLVCYGDNISPSVTAGGKKYAIWVLTDKSTDRVRAENLEYQPGFNLSNRLTVLDNKYRPADGNLVADRIFSIALHSTTSGKDYLFTGGNYFFYNWAVMGWFYSFPVNTMSVSEAPYKVAPYVFMTSNGAVFFDETHNRFEAHIAGTNEIASNSATLLRTTRLTSGAYFDWQDPDYRLLYMDNRTTTTGFAVVRNDRTGRYEFLQMSLATAVVEGAIVIAANQIGKAEFPAGANLDNIKFFAYHNTLPYLFLASEDRVYRINTSAMTTLDDITAQVLPAGYKVSKIKNSAIRFPRTNQIVIASYNPGGPAGENGQLALYEVEDGTGNLKLAKHPVAPTDDGYQIDMKWTGLGKVISVDYKNPQ
ncbi:MAG: hypothetical protein LBU22_12320 [Dysgonamonadaceae bacterium]|jgi:hypothetical protein|nr:hypothetical protein [Dysgonamonadaceae bacterium]